MDGSRPEWLTDERLKIYPLAIFFAVVAAVLFSTLTADGASSVGGRLGGDYAAFHAAGTLVYEGRTAELYDWRAQAEMQAGLHPDEPDRFLAFVYPPFVALMLVPFAAVGFKAGYLLHTALAGLAAWLGIVAIAPHLRRVGKYRLALFVFLCCLYPLFRAITGGQNTAFTLCVIAWAWRLDIEDRPFLSGLVAGLLLCKPQFGLLLAGFLILRRKPSFLAGFGLAALSWFAIGTAMGGPGWVLWWWEQIGTFHAFEQTENAANSVDVMNWFGALLGANSLLSMGVGGVIWGLVAVGALLAWVRPSRDPVVQLGFMSLAVVLLPPHSMFYDAGIAGLGLLVWLDRTRNPGWVIAAWSVGLTALFSDAIGVNPLFAVCIAVGVGLWVETKPAPGEAKPV